MVNPKSGLVAFCLCVALMSVGRADAATATFDVSVGRLTITGLAVTGVQAPWGAELYWDGSGLTLANVWEYGTFTIDDDPVVYNPYAGDLFVPAVTIGGAEFFLDFRYQAGRFLLRDYGQSVALASDWEGRMEHANGYYDSTYFVGLVETGDGGILAIGHATLGEATKSDVYAYRYDVSGNHLWTRFLYGTNYNDEPVEVRQLVNGNIVVVGTEASETALDGYSERNPGIFILEMDQEGVVSWQTSLSDGGFDGYAFQALSFTEDGGYAILADDGSYSIIRSYFFRLNASGQVAMDAVDLFQSSEEGYFTDHYLAMASAGDGRFVSVGNKYGYRYADGSYLNSFTFRVLDSAGALLSEQDLAIDFAPTRMFRAADGNFFVIGNTSSGRVAKLSPDGQILWLADLRKVSQLNSLIELPDGDIVVVGSVNNTSKELYHYDGSIARLSQGGTIKWQKFLTSESLAEDREFFYDVVSDGDGVYTVAGMSTVQTTYQDASLGVLEYSAERGCLMRISER